MGNFFYNLQQWETNKVFPFAHCCCDKDEQCREERSCLSVPMSVHERDGVRLRSSAFPITPIPLLRKHGFKAFISLTCPAFFRCSLQTTTKTLAAVEQRTLDGRGYPVCGEDVLRIIIF